MKRKVPNYKLTADQEKAIRFLSEGHSSEETANAMNVDPGTLRQWRQKDIGFITTYNDAISDQHRVFIRKLAEGRTRAIERLIELIDHSDTNVVIKAAAILTKLDIPQPEGETDPEKMEASMNPFSRLLIR